MSRLKYILYGTEHHTAPTPNTADITLCPSPSPHLSPSPLHSPSYSTPADSLAQLYITGRKSSHALGDYIMDRSHIECQECNFSGLSRRSTAIEWGMINFERECIAVKDKLWDCPEEPIMNLSSINSSLSMCLYYGQGGVGQRVPRVQKDK